MTIDNNAAQTSVAQDRGRRQELAVLHADGGGARAAVLASFTAT
jgi:hypothetical protein